MCRAPGRRPSRWSRPWGTAAVNISGAALFGVLLASHATGRASDVVVTVVSTGFAGGFTNFSTWIVESVRLAEPGHPRHLIAAAQSRGFPVLTLASVGT